jgi:hypothetical protein
MPRKKEVRVPVTEARRWKICVAEVSSGPKVLQQLLSAAHGHHRDDYCGPAELMASAKFESTDLIFS